jgi:hypothetical protein
MKTRFLIVAATLVLSPAALAQQGNFYVKPLVEKRVSALPDGELFWHLSTFDTSEQAQKVAGPLGLVAEYDGKVWLFTLGHAEEAPKSGKQVAKIGPLPQITANEYLLRVNEAGGSPGSETAAHTHPGSESFYVISGELTQRTRHGEARLAAGESMVGHGGGDTFPQAQPPSRISAILLPPITPAHRPNGPPIGRDNRATG